MGVAAAFFYLFAVGDIFVGPGDAADGVVEIVHRRGGDAHVDQRAVLPPAPQLHIADGLALEGAVEQRADVAVEIAFAVDFREFGRKLELMVFAERCREGRWEETMGRWEETM